MSTIHFSEIQTSRSTSEDVTQTFNISHRKWYRMKGFLRFSRILFSMIHLVMNYLLLDTLWPVGVSLYMGTSVSSFTILWDVIDFAVAELEKRMPLVVAVAAESSLVVGAFVVLILDIIYWYGLENYRQSHLAAHIGANLAWLPILYVGAIFAHRLIRAYPEHRRYRRDIRNIKPIIVFTRTGDPVAVLPFACNTIEMTTGRLSVDSLQQIPGNRD